MSKLLDLLDIIPGWIWAAALVASMVGALVLTMELSTERLRSAQLSQKLAQERLDHQTAVAAATNRTIVAERALRASRAEQEKKDADAQVTIADMGERLRRLAAAGGLRDPFAAPCRGAADAGPGPAAAAGGEDPAEAGRALSPEFSGAVVSLLRDADDINAAYASCRADAVGLRLQLRQLSPPPGSASAGSP